jgi:hypothetical protein
MCGASMTSRGGFHWRFALSVPITISVALAMAFIPVGDAMLGFIPIFVATNVISFVLSTVFLTTPIFHSDAHKTFGRGLGLPMMVLLSLFFTILVGYGGAHAHFGTSACGAGSSCRVLCDRVRRTQALEAVAPPDLL